MQSLVRVHFQFEITTVKNVQYCQFKFQMVANKHDPIANHCNPIANDCDQIAIGF